MLPPRHDRRADLRGPAREPCPRKQAIPHLCHAARSPQPSSRQRPAEGDVEHVHDHPGGQAVVGMVAMRSGQPGVGTPAKSRNDPMQSRLPMHLSPHCHARTRAGTPCQSPAMTNGRRRMHRRQVAGGAAKGNRNAFRHGRYTATAVAGRRQIAALIRTMRAPAGSTDDTELNPLATGGGHRFFLAIGVCGRQRRGRTPPPKLNWGTHRPRVRAHQPPANQGYSAPADAVTMLWEGPPMIPLAAPKFLCLRRYLSENRPPACPF